MPFPRSAYFSSVRFSSKTIVIRRAMPPPRCQSDVPDNVRESRGSRGRDRLFDHGCLSPMYRIIGHYPIVSPTAAYHR
jgi:hypothetical protein